VSGDFRSESRRRWGDSAAGWRRRADQMRMATMPVSARMVELVAPKPGDALLELAAGIGDVGFLASPMLEPGGILICSDFAPEMLTGAQERAKDLGIVNARFRQIDAESIDLPAASLDGVLCRWGLMLMSDPEAALRQCRRVLKPGGRLALAAWQGPEVNPWSSLPQAELRRLGLVEPPDPAAPGQFAWSRQQVIAETLQAAGFVDFELDSVDFVMAYDDLDHWWQTQRDLSRSFSDGVAAADPGRLAAVRAAMAEAAEGFKAPDGTLAVPARTWVAGAVA
jgi:SAM-dependent methyltransferase